MKTRKILLFLACISMVLCLSCSRDNDDDSNNNNGPLPDENEKFLGTYSGNYSCSNGTNYGTINLTVTAGVQPNEIVFDGAITATVSGNNFPSTRHHLFPLSPNSLK